MASKNVHGFNIEHDESSDTANSYIEHLENNLSHEEMKALVERAKHDPLSKVHLEDRYGNRVTMEYKDEDHILIRKRQS